MEEIRKKGEYFFQGVIVLGTNIRIQIVRVFTKIRKVLTDTLNFKLEMEKIKKQLSNNTKNSVLVFNYLDELIDKKENSEPRKEIGFKQRERNPKSYSLKTKIIFSFSFWLLEYRANLYI